MNNYQYVNYDWYNMNRQYQPNNLNLYNPEEAIIRGNLFKDLYREYKNYKPRKPQLRTDQERKLFEIQSLCFASHELNLYLDLHPEDQSMLRLMNDYIIKKDQLVKEYENKYGPLTLNNTSNKTTFNWVNNTWPWEEYNV